MTRRTVFIVDAQPPFRAGLRSVLEGAGLEVVGEAADSTEAIESIAELRPAICVIDADVRGGGILAVSRITNRSPDSHVLVLAAAVSPDGLLGALRAGASGYLPRSTVGAGFVRALESVLEGEFAITRAAIASLVHEVRGAGGRQQLSVGGAPVSLTDREAQVLELLATAMTTQQIASELDVSPVTVRRHLSAIAGKLGKRGRRQLLSVVRAA